MWVGAVCPVLIFVHTRHAVTCTVRCTHARSEIRCAQGLSSHHSPYECLLGTNLGVSTAVGTTGTETIRISQILGKRKEKGEKSKGKGRGFFVAALRTLGTLILYKTGFLLYILLHETW